MTRTNWMATVGGCALHSHRPPTRPFQRNKGGSVAREGFIVRTPPPPNARFSPMFRTHVPVTGSAGHDSKLVLDRARQNAPRPRRADAHMCQKSRGYHQPSVFNPRRGLKRNRKSGTRVGHREAASFKLYIHTQHGTTYQLQCTRVLRCVD